MLRSCYSVSRLATVAMVVFLAGQAALIASAADWTADRLAVPFPPTASEQELLEKLRSGSPAEKAFACKQLAIYGSKASVPELAKLLGDKQLASWARIALEAIPDASADAALIEAAKSLDGRLLVGTINSIGFRRPAAASEQLATCLNDNDTEVACAAAVALGKIATTRAPARRTGTRTTGREGGAMMLYTAGLSRPFRTRVGPCSGALGWAPARPGWAPELAEAPDRAREWGPAAGSGRAAGPGAVRWVRWPYPRHCKSRAARPAGAAPRPRRGQDRRRGGDDKGGTGGARRARSRPARTRARR